MRKVEEGAEVLRPSTMRAQVIAWLSQATENERLPPKLRRRVRKVRKLLRRPERFVRDIFVKSQRDETSGDLALSPEEALRENGFYVARGLLPSELCRDLATRLRARHPVSTRGEYTSIDAASRSEIARELLFDPRVLEAVRTCIGRDIRFLQIADLQIDHDHTAWHRDSAYRTVGGLDWDERDARYAVVKVLLYLESEGAGLAMRVGSHEPPTQTDEAMLQELAEERRFKILDDNSMHRRVPREDRKTTRVFVAKPGDALIFDERLYHRGRRVSEGAVTNERSGKKLTVSFVFGPDDVHSRRIHSYFRYARSDLPFRDIPKALLDRLDAAGLVPSTRYRNHFEDAPEELAGVWLKHPEERATLIAKFASSKADALPSLRVVPLSRTHAAELFAQLSDPALYRFIPGDPKPDVASLSEEFARLLRGSPTPNETWLNWVLYVEGKPAGTLQATVREDKSAIVGYVIFKEFWRRGIGTRGVSWLLEELFRRREVEEAWAYVDPNNIASIRLLERLRFSECAKTTESPEHDRVYALKRANYVA